jgi:hypothetical protein
MSPVEASHEALPHGLHRAADAVGVFGRGKPPHRVVPQGVGVHRQRVQGSSIAKRYEARLAVNIVDKDGRLTMASLHHQVQMMRNAQA